MPKGGQNGRRRVTRLTTMTIRELEGRRTEDKESVHSVQSVQAQGEVSTPLSASHANCPPMHLEMRNEK